MSEARGSIIETDVTTIDSIWIDAFIQLLLTTDLTSNPMIRLQSLEGNTHLAYFASWRQSEITDHS